MTPLKLDSTGRTIVPVELEDTFNKLWSQNTDGEMCSAFCPEHIYGACERTKHHTGPHVNYYTVRSRPFAAWGFSQHDLVVLRLLS